MNKQERDKLRELAAKATPGPWGVDRSGADEPGIFSGVTSLEGVTVISAYIPYEDTGVSNSDAWFIASVNPNQIIKFLDSYERLVEALEYIEKCGREQSIGALPPWAVEAHLALSRLKDAGEHE